MKIAIVGGTGKFGSFYARVFKRHGFEVTIIGRNREKGKRIEKEIGISFTTSFDETKSADVVIFSTPIEVTPELMLKLPYKENALIADFCSVKGGVIYTYEELEKRKDLELISLHPLHGVNVSSLEGLRVAYIPIRKGEKAKILLSVFEKEGMEVFETTFEEHDKMMAYTQALPHLLALIGGKILGKKEGLRKFGTTNFFMFYHFIARVFHIDEKIILGIQFLNPYAEKIREEVREALSKMKQGEIETILREGRQIFSERDIAISKKMIFTMENYMKEKMAVFQEGTFTHLAAKEFLKRRNKKLSFLYADSIQEIFRKVEEYEATLGIVPVENSIEGSVDTTLDLLFDSNVFVQHEIIMDIHHCLFALPEHGKIRYIFSHPQALSQCRKYISLYFPEAKLVPTKSTAEALKLLVEENRKDSAAIGMKDTGIKLGLKLLAENIEDKKNNKTRFFIIGNEKKEHGRKTSIAIYDAKDRPGLLRDLLNAFAKRDINLTRIESRPSGERLGEYIFFLDFEGSLKEKRVKEALEEIGELAKIKIFGSYDVEEI